MAVCVSSLLIAEIKRIIKESEIMKYVDCFQDVNHRRTDGFPGKMTPNGQRRTKMGAKNWKLG